MLPWNYGFHWNVGHVVFLGAFYIVLLIVSVTLIAALRRSRRALLEHRVEQIAWAADFHDLPSADRICRHELTGELDHRQCPNAFDCRRCATHAMLLQRRPAPEAVAPEAEIFGMAFPLDRYYHRGHTWVHPEPDGTVTVGLDELGRRLLADPESMQLPEPGARIEVNGTAYRVQKSGADVRVLSPVDGQVIEVGGPDRGWYLKVKPSEPGEMSLRHLLRGAEVKPWLMREMERLQFTLAAQGARATLADGGVPVADISTGYPAADWDAVCGEMFLEP